MQSACAVLHCHLWPVWLYHIFQHYLINGTIFGGKAYRKFKSLLLLFTRRPYFSLSISLAVRPYFSLSIYLSPSAYDLLSLSPSSYNLTSLSISLVVRHYLSLSLYLSIYLSPSPYDLTSLSIYLSPSPYDLTSLSIYLSIYLPRRTTLLLFQTFLLLVATNCVATSRAMAQAVSRRPLTAEARVRSRVRLCGIYGGQSVTGTGFSPEYFCFPLSISFHRCSITRKN
jgi:hypothetical protein